MGMGISFFSLLSRLLFLFLLIIDCTVLLYGVN